MLTGEPVSVQKAEGDGMTIIAGAAMSFSSVSVIANALCLRIVSLDPPH